jgi:hypothetical protein
MAAGNHDILIEQGATFKMVLIITDETSSRVDLTGLTFRGMVKKAFTDSSAQASFSFNVLDQTVPETKGKVEVILSSTQTTGIDVYSKGPVRSINNMVYDIESEDLSGVVIRWLQGAASVSPEVTK